MLAVVIAVSIAVIAAVVIACGVYYNHRHGRLYENTVNAEICRRLFGDE